MSKYRVVIRAHTARRDVAPAALLAKILERRGCSVIITCTRNFEPTLRMWEPHAVVIYTPGLADNLRRRFPHVKLVFLEGECFQAIPGARAKRWAAKHEEFEALDLALLCGCTEYEGFDTYGNGLDRSRVHVVGNPKLDLVRFLPEDLKKRNESGSIGVVGRFPVLNHHEGLPAFRNITSEKSLNQTINATKAFYATFRTVDSILRNTDLEVSFRPHPNEAVEYYHEIVKQRFEARYRDRIDVDSSLDFASWAVRHKALVSPTSTSFLEASLLGVPVINLDRIADTVEFNRDYAAVAAEWQESALMPKDLDQLCAILGGQIPPPKITESIEKQLNDQCDWANGSAANLRAADRIMALLKDAPRSPRMHWPRFLVGLRDEISFRRALRKNRLHANFNYKAGFHKLPAHFDRMVDDIMERG